MAPVRIYIESLVHPTAQQDALAAARHRAFIAPRLLGSIVGLALFPVYLMMAGAPSAAELIVLAWLIAPILVAYFLSRTGRYESAHILSAVALTGLVTAVACLTGGMTSLAAVWLVLVPIEASLSASLRAVAAASAVALAGAGLLAMASALNLLPPRGVGEHLGFVNFGIVPAVLYAAGLAFGAATLPRTSFRLRHADEDRYRLLARNTTDVITRHGGDGAVLFASPAARHLFGCGIAELAGHGLFGRVHVADRPAYLTALADASALGESGAVEFRVRRGGCDAHGDQTPQFVWVEMRCRPLEAPAADGGGAGRREVVAAFRDITDRKQHEEALRDMRAEAELASAAKSGFLATMSHELRTPLNAIIGFSNMLTNESALMLDAERRAEYARMINDSGHHLLAVINGILDVSKLETGNFELVPEPIAPASAVVACCNALAPQANEAGVTIDQTPLGNLPDMIADKRALNHILLNLVSNAIRLSDPGGTVTVGARADAGAITFTVEDDGGGFNGETLARSGKSHFQAGSAHDRRCGASFGMSIVEALVRLHGGEITIRNRIGKGRRVDMRLPLDCEQARPDTRRARHGTIHSMRPVLARQARAAATDMRVAKRA